MIPTLLALGAVAAAWTLAYHRASALAWAIAVAALAVALEALAAAPRAAVAAAWVAAAIFAALSIRPLRRAVATRPLFGVYKRILPQVSQTEQEALDAGSIWWDADLFSGRPDWKKLLGYAPARLSEEEKDRKSVV